MSVASETELHHYDVVKQLRKIAEQQLRDKVLQGTKPVQRPINDDYETVERTAWLWEI